MKNVLEKYLTKFEESIDLEHQQQARQACARVYEWQDVETLPFIRRDVSKAPDQDWPSFPYNDTFTDESKMLLDQLRGPFFHNQLRDYHALNIRTNYGTVIMPSLFGLGYQLTETSLPWVHHAPGREEIERIIARGAPDARAGLGARCYDTAAFYRAMLAPYPKLSKAISIYHPDMQGPFDVAHLIWGPDIFYALYDCPELVHQLLSLVTETYKQWLRAWKQFVGEGSEFITHWNFYMKGGAMLRDDTAVTISLQHYEEFVKPYDQAVLDEFGGCIHFCGRGTAFFRSMCESRNLYGIALSQPDWNDMNMVLSTAQDRRLVMVGLARQYVPANARTGFIVWN